MFEWNCGCGCVGIISFIIGFGIALILGNTLLVAIGVGCVIFGVWLAIGNIVYIAGEILLGTQTN